MRIILSILLLVGLQRIAAAQDWTCELLREVEAASQIAALKDADPGMRAGAARMLRWASPGSRDVIEALLTALLDTDERVRQEAAESLGLVDIRGESLARLRVLLDARQRPEVRRAAAIAVGGIGAPAAGIVPPLIEMLDQDEVAEEAALALVRLDGDGRSVPVLIGLLKRPPSKSRDAAIAALGNLAPLADEAIPSLINILGEPEPSLAAPRALGQFYGRASHSLPVLKALKAAEAESDSLLPYYVDEAIRKIEGADRFPVPVQSGVPPPVSEREKAYDKVRGATVAELIALLQHDDTGRRVSAAMELSRRGPAALDSLEQAVRTGDTRTRSLAALALGEDTRPEGRVSSYLIVIPPNPGREIIANLVEKVSDQLCAASAAEWEAATCTDDEYRHSAQVALRLRVSLTRATKQTADGELVDAVRHVASVKRLEAELAARLFCFVPFEVVELTLLRGQLRVAEAQRELGYATDDRVLQLSACRQCVLIADRIWGLARSAYGAASRDFNQRTFTDAFTSRTDARIALAHQAIDVQAGQALLEPLLAEAQHLILHDVTTAPWLKYDVARIRAALAHLNGDRQLEAACLREGLVQLKSLAQGLNDRVAGRQYLRYSWSLEYFALQGAMAEQLALLQELDGQTPTESHAGIAELERLVIKARGFCAVEGLSLAEYDYIAAHYLLALLKKQ